eukprot:CAMPEP_0115259764 /NCGR_PEP_ID=MMETSP0270-20121206/47992_2 /TAXON_ID=71861 /ORGANISM="Scrippsiella trochoidea, Strain CCMP3099" /LENGTH=108 /DNA_ID=CAMNT_0002675583 /DNA_START=598 /DNA_END=924 /DNA_ORIENTATION=-
MLQNDLGDPRWPRHGLEPGQDSSEALAAEHINKTLAHVIVHARRTLRNDLCGANHLDLRILQGRVRNLVEGNLRKVCRCNAKPLASLTSESSASRTRWEKCECRGAIN